MEQKNKAVQTPTDTTPPLPGLGDNRNGRRTLDGHTRPARSAVLSTGISTSPVVKSPVATAASSPRKTSPIPGQSGPTETTVRTALVLAAP